MFTELIQSIIAKLENQDYLINVEGKYIQVEIDDLVWDLIFSEKLVICYIVERDRPFGYNLGYLEYITGSSQKIEALNNQIKKTLQDDVLIKNGKRLSFKGVLSRFCGAICGKEVKDLVALLDGQNADKPMENDTALSLHQVLELNSTEDFLITLLRDYMRV